MLDLTITHTPNRKSGNPLVPGPEPIQNITFCFACDNIKNLLHVYVCQALF